MPLLQFAEPSDLRRHVSTLNNLLKKGDLRDFEPSSAKEGYTVSFVGGKFLLCLYHGITDSVTAVILRFSRYYHGKTACRKKRGWFYHGITMVITVFLGWLFRKKKRAVLPW